jgi:adenosylcobinamide kinase / adenosylcobinamide-phosphate guanylyltransferase
MPYRATFEITLSRLGVFLLFKTAVSNTTEQRSIMQHYPKLTLVTGGIASGKSRWAEELVTTSDRKKVYIATAQSFDVEMETKIARHRKDRDDLWRTIEAPLDLAGALAGAWQDEIILVDCLTMWLSNHLLAKHDPGAAADQLIDALAALEVPVVLVTNEVGAGGVSGNKLARRFAQEQGRLNQRIAKRADLVVAVISGLPLALKGLIPDGAQ